MSPNQKAQGTRTCCSCQRLTGRHRQAPMSASGSAASGSQVGYRSRPWSPPVARGAEASRARAAGCTPCTTPWTVSGRRKSRAAARGRPTSRWHQTEGHTRDQSCCASGLPQGFGPVVPPQVRRRRGWGKGRERPRTRGTVAMASMSLSWSMNAMRLIPSQEFLLPFMSILNSVG